MEVVNTVYERDVEISHDVFAPTARKESEGITVEVRE